jgi:hypothetical protein
MSDSESQRSARSKVRVALPTAADIERAKSLPADACPRRYCFWWGPMLFEWDLSPQDGCTFLHRGKPPGWLLPNTPCCRSDSSSPIDHYEINDPAIESDGIDASRWEEACERSRDPLRKALLERTQNSE